MMAVGAQMGNSKIIKRLLSYEHRDIGRYERNEMAPLFVYFMMRLSKNQHAEVEIAVTRRQLLHDEIIRIYTRRGGNFPGTETIGTDLGRHDTVVGVGNG